MVTMINTVNGAQPPPPHLASHPPLLPTDLTVPHRTDVLDLGKGSPVPLDEALNIVVERSIEKLRAVVVQAREELGLPDDAVIDTSPESTAGRIADFALGAYDQYRQNHKLEDNEASRAQFSEFIGNAINQGMAEARDILQSLQSLTPEIDTNITKTWDIIQQRFDDFIGNGLSS